jgi:hypothetical protein
MLECFIKKLLYAYSRLLEQVDDAEKRPLLGMNFYFVATFLILSISNEDLSK